MHAPPVPAMIEDYALIGDTQTAALVSRHGSIDWWCVPRFDSAACFAALLGGPDNGRWSIAPRERPTAITRRYRGDTLVLETVFTTATGRVALIDFMPVRERGHPTIVRIVEGLEGAVTMRLEGSIRFDYGAIVPWVHATEDERGITATGGADALALRANATLRGVGLETVAEFDVDAGTRTWFTATWYPSHEPAPPSWDALAALADTEAWWSGWVEACTYDGPHRDAVLRSLITLKGLTYAPTGGIVAAPTTSLPELVGGVRNWDYRYCWLRDATFTLHVLLVAGHDAEAAAWSAWLRRAVAGSPDKLQIMYGVGGERRLDEYEVGWLPGYEGSAPVRVGNAASGQFQLDVYGEVMDMFLTAALHDLSLPPDSVDLARMLVEHVEQVWREPDDGIWEVRGPRRHFVHSKVMAWVAIDRWLRLVDELGLEEPVGDWEELRDEIHREVCEKGYDPALGSFTQHYGSTELDASLLMLALVGFLPPTDPRIAGTVDAIRRDLVVDGFVRRYRTGDGGDGGAGAGTDGLPPGEGAFLLTTFWLVDNLALLGHHDEAVAMLDRLLSLRNDVGLLSEEYDVGASRMVGNFPQAFSHVGLLNSVFNLHDPRGEVVARRRARPPGDTGEHARVDDS